MSLLLCRWGSRCLRKVHRLAQGSPRTLNRPAQPELQEPCRTLCTCHPIAAVHSGGRVFQWGTATLGRSQHQGWFQTLESLLPRKGGGVINSLDSSSPPQAQIPHPRPASASWSLPAQVPTACYEREENCSPTVGGRGGQSPSGPHPSDQPPMKSNCKPTTPLHAFGTAVLERGEAQYF